MKSHQLLSDKDLQILKITYRTVIENYYENSSDENSSSIILLNALTMQTISTRQQSDALLLISMLQILKVKAKANKQLGDSIQNTIIHLKNPLKIYLKDATIQQCLDNISIYHLCCVVLIRFYQQEMKPKLETYNWKQIISKVGKNSDKNMQIAVETAVNLLPDFPSYAKQISKSGMIKYLCSVYLPQVIQNKLSLYRALKLLKIVALNDRGVLLGREKNIALVIYNYPAYILIVQQIEQSCFDQQHALKVLNNVKDIDPLYVWSYNCTFCTLSNDRIVEQLERMMKEGGKGIAADLQWKLYSTINNLVKNKNYRLTQSWRIPMNAQKNLNAYLKLATTMVQKNPQQLYKNIDIKAIQYVYDKSKTSDPVTNKLIKDLKNMDPNNTGKKIGKLQSSILQQFSIEKNPQILMERAAKIPRNNEELLTIQEILLLSIKGADQFQIDTIKTLKNKALQSLRASITLNYPIDFPNFFNKINTDVMDPETINKLLKLGQLYLTMNPDSVNKFNSKKFLELLEWLQNNYGSAIIDWIAASQILSILFGPDQWKSHLNQIPKRCFWLLNSVDSELTGDLMTKISSVPLSHPKAPLLLGFIAKNGDTNLKKLLLKSKLMDYMINEVCTYKNSRTSVKSYASKPEDDFSDGEIMQKYLNNVLNLSHYIYNWNNLNFNKQIQGKIIRPCLQNVIRCFNGSQHEFKFLENCLPYRINVNQLKDVNLARLLQTHGKLTSYLHNNKYPGKIDFSRISTIASEKDPQKIQEILKFLQENPQMIEENDLVALLDQLLRNAKRQNKYWRLYPNYMSIINHIADIACKSNKPQVIAKLTDILQKIIANTAENQDIAPEELDQLYENICSCLDRLIQRKVKIDCNRLKREAQKIKDEEWKKKIIEKLKLMNQISMKIEPKKVQATKVMLENETSQIKLTSANKYESIPANLQDPKTVNLQISRMQNTSIIPASKLGASTLQINMNPDFEEKKDENMVHAIDTNEIIKNQQSNSQSQTPEELRLLDALKLLKKIVKKEQPKQTFPKLVDIFMVSDLNRNKRYVLGQLLTEYYEIIEKDKRVIALLQLKDKTNLSKETCYKFLSKFQQAFLISKRWKLIGYEFEDLAMQRTKCNNENKPMCVQNGCEVAEYNLIKNNDISYFESKGYHKLTLQLFPKIATKSQAIYYLLLVGSSSRLVDIKTFFIANKLHTNLMSYANKQDWIKDVRISANLSYALSSLIYTQNQIATQIAQRKNDMLKIMSSYKQFSTTKSVVEAGCSLLSNICYSNKQTKQMLYQYGIAQLLLHFANKNLQNPEVSTFKQIMRTLGNISLHKPCAQKLIDGHICNSIIAMIQKFNIFIYRDEEKVKVLKLTVDFISNLASHKYNLQTMHKEGITNFVITLLQTTQISEDQILMSCIDTIDGLCQSQHIQNYVVMDKKLLLQLIDLLKVKQDQKLITKSIRLITNMTLNQTCIPYILQANMLSVLSNVVLPVYKNEKIDTYINKIILRIFARKPDIKLILKSGYLDCLIKTIQINEKIDDSYIDILFFYCQYIPNYLNHRAFFNIIKLLTTKQNQKQTVQKCLRIIKVIFSSEDREDDDILIEGSTSMYEKLLLNNQANKNDIVYLIGLHCTKSSKFKKQLLADCGAKKTNLVDYILKMANEDTNSQLGLSVLFAITNSDRSLYDVGSEVVKEEDSAYKIMLKGIQCKLFRMDGSSKSAIIDIDETYLIRAYKYPDGQIKKKYVMSIRQLRDWQLIYQPNSDAWEKSVFMKSKGGMFESAPVMERCATLLGSQEWGSFSLINIQFLNVEDKITFIKAMSALIIAFKHT